MQIESVGILTIATNKYVHYWNSLGESINLSVGNSSTKITLYVFTDQLNLVNEMSGNWQNLNVQSYEIPAYEWPHATLYRYRLIKQYQDEFTDDLLVHLDADMHVRANFVSALPKNLINGIGLVLHPGFFRPSGFELLKYYFTNLKRLLLDVKSIVLIGGIGSWEKNSKFLAYVPRALRNHYVCGGTWLGLREEFMKMVSELAEIEIEDTEKGLIPTWHDESILNKWSSQNPTSLLSPSFCYDPTYPQLRNLPEYIRAVDKGKS